MAGSLTPEQVRSYERDGYLFPVGVFDVDEVAAFRADFVAFEDRWSDAPGLARPFVQYVRDGMHVISPAADRMARHPAVLDVVESVLMVWTCEMLVKEPHSPQMLTMHQDHRYWGFGSSGDQVTAWVALSEVTDANGAMRFVRGSHLFGDVDHHDTFGADNVLSRGQEITIGHDPADEVVVALHPGELSLHHGTQRVGRATSRDRHPVRDALDPSGDRWRRLRHACPRRLLRRRVPDAARPRHGLRPGDGALPRTDAGRPRRHPRNRSWTADGLRPRPVSRVGGIREVDDHLRTGSGQSALDG